MVKELKMSRRQKKHKEANKYYKNFQAFLFEKMS
jgi:hypothetical protein